MKFKVMTAIFALALVAGFAGSAGASKASAAPGNGFVGACNMLADATMGTIPMVHDLNGNGNAGMDIAVTVSGGLPCPP